MTVQTGRPAVALLRDHGEIARRLARSSVTAFGVYVTGAGLTYGAQVAIARVVGSADYGIYAYVFSWVTVLAYLATLGFDVALLRLIPAYRARHEWGLMRGVMRYAQRCAAAGGGAIVVGGAALVVAFGPGIATQLGRTFILGLVLVPVWALLWIRCAAVRGHGGVASALVPDRIARDGILLLLIVLLVAVWHVRLDAASVMGLTLISSLTGLILISVALRQWQPAVVGRAAMGRAVTDWRMVALPLVVISVAETLQNRTGILLLGWVGQTRAAGIYALAFNLAMVVALPRTAINALFAPMISDLFVRGDRRALQYLITRTAWWTLASGLAIALPLGLLAGTLLSWFGPDFANGAGAMRILLIGQVAAAAAGPQLFVLTMTGHERPAVVLLVVSVAFNVVAAVGLIRFFGLDGAAIATTATFVMWNLGMGVFVARRLSLVPGVFGVLGVRGRAGSG